MNRKLQTENNNEYITIRKSHRSDNNEYKIIGGFKVRSKSKEQIDELYKEHVLKVKEKYERLFKKNPKNKNLESDRNIELKRCEVCLDFENDSGLLLCDFCEDGYHIYCLSPPLNKIPEDFACEKCKSETKKEKMRQTTIQFIKSTIKNPKVILPF
jgi:hypothetical protein